MTTARAATQTLQAGRPGMVWIEDGVGTIVRGLVDSATAEGAQVRLSEAPPFHTGDEVALRICREPGAPTFGTTARVGWLHAGEDAVECGLEWSPAQDERAALDAWLGSAA
jgi:PilZ domain